MKKRMTTRKTQYDSIASKANALAPSVKPIQKSDILFARNSAGERPAPRPARCGEAGDQAASLHSPQEAAERRPYQRDPASSPRRCGAGHGAITFE
jgi:hypothetical protein